MPDYLPAYNPRVAPGGTPLNRQGPNAFRRASDAEGMARIGAAVDRVGQATNQVQQVLDAKERERLEQKRRNDIARMKNEVRQRTSRTLREGLADFQANSGDGAEGFYENFETWVGERKAEELARLSDQDEETRLAVEREFQNLSQPFLNSAAKYQIDETVSYRQRMLTGSLDEMGNAIYSNPGQFDVFLGQGRAAIEEDGNLPPAFKREMLDQWNGRAAKAAFNGTLEANPWQALKDAQGGRYDKLWSPESKAAAVNAAQAEIKRREVLARAQQSTEADFTVADLELAVRRGDKSYQDIQDARDDGYFDDKPQKFTQLMTLADGVQEKQIEAAEEAEALQSKLAAGLGLDTQEEADKVWKQRAAQLGEEPAEEDVFALLAQTTRDTGILPTEAKRIIRNAERMPNADQLSQSAKMFLIMDDVAPGVDVGAGDRVRLAASLVADAGMDYDEAATQVLANAPDQTALKARREEIKALALDFDEEAANRLPDMEGFFGGNRTSIQIAAEMERRFKALYELSGNQDLALDAAARQMKETWGTSLFNDGNAMRLPPERYKPGTAANLSGEQYKDVVDAEIRQSLSSSGIDAPYRLDADMVMSKASMARGGGPLYRVMVENDFGAMIPLADQNGDLVLYSLPGSKEVAASDVYKKQVAEERDLLKRRHMLSGQQKSMAQRGEEKAARFRSGGSSAGGQDMLPDAN